MRKLKTESHYKLALYLSESLLGSFPSHIRAAFVTGCVEPDFNLFSYLKGFSVRPFYGHNWENSREYIAQTFSEFKSRGCINTADFFKLGRLIHYVTDAFTYTHNRMYTGTLREHTLYEKQLHKVFMPFIDSSQPIRLSTYFALSHDISSAHARYSIQNMTPENDAEWIMSVSASLIRAVEVFTAEQTQRSLGSATEQH